ncbi:MAG: lasso peptide biosynthesis B2 protein [Nitrospiraceae bacterium]
MSSVRKYYRIVRIGLLILAIRIALQAISLRRLLDWLHQGEGVCTGDGPALDEIAYYVDRWLALFPYNKKGNCFPRALSLYRYARRYGVPVEFHCGVRKSGTNLDGHAWLMLSAEPFMETTQHWKTFAVTFSFPHSASSSSPTGCAGTRSAMSRSR